MTTPVTELLWITHDTITPLHIDGLKTGLAMVGALSHAQIRIMAVSENSAVVIPGGAWTFPNGKVVHGGTVLGYDTLPAQGLLIAAAETAGDAD